LRSTRFGFVSVLEDAALEVAAGGRQGYGIFSGLPENTAVLHFDARCREVG
jgi:hypothetical protein